MTKLLEAFRLRRLGLSWPKAWELAPDCPRQPNVAFVLIILLLAYVVVAWNDEAAAVEAAARHRTARIEAEANLAHCLNGGWFNSSMGLISCGRAS